ncbi:MAG: TRAP transporter substrate-binding protein [Rectinema sp.]
MKRAFVIMMALGMLLTAWNVMPVQAQTTYELIAQGTGPLGSPDFDPLYLGFKNEVEKNSNGRIKVKFYPLQSFAPDREYLEFLEKGTADVFMGSTLTMGLLDPAWNVTYLPFLFDSWAQTFSYFEGAPGKYLADRLLKQYGIRILAYGISAPRSFSNNKKPIRVPADIKGMKIRSPETEPVDLWIKSLGADPVVLSFPEMMPALQQGVVNGQDIGLIAGRILRMQEIQKYWNNVIQNYIPVPVSISEKTWQKLPADLQQVVQNAAIKASHDQRAKVEESDKSLAEWAKSNNLVYVEVTESERQQWVDTAKKIWLQYESKINKIDPNLMKITFDFVGKNWK